MIALKTADMRNDFKHVSEIVTGGESVLISRPHNDNIVVLSERVYNDLLRAQQNTEYLSKVRKSIQELENGNIIVKTMEELEAMTE